MAWAEAENVKMGRSLGPQGSRAWRVSMSPVVHDETATTWSIPSRLAAWSSTRDPLVSMPRS